MIMPSRRRIYDLIEARDEEGAANEMGRNIDALNERYLSAEAGQIKKPIKGKKRSPQPQGDNAHAIKPSPKRSRAIAL